MTLKELLSKPVSLKLNARSSAAGLYVGAAVVLFLSASCDIAPTSAKMRQLYTYEAALSDAQSCLDNRVGELDKFEARQGALEQRLRPYTKGDPEPTFLVREQSLRDRHAAVSFVHVDPPKQVDQPAATPTPSPAPTLGPIVVVPVAKAKDCLAGLPAPAAMPTPTPAAGAAPTPTPTPLPTVDAFVGETFEYELDGPTRETLDLDAALSGIPLALQANDMSFDVQRGRGNSRVVDSKTSLILYRVTLPTPVPYAPPTALGATYNAQTSTEGAK